MKTKSTEISNGRAGERGAALVTALLVSMLMLAAGGALIISTGMSAANAVDATAEAQAYYAADSGLQAALNILRRNKPSANPTGVLANFHNVVCGSTASCTNGGNNLSAWLTYTNGFVQLSNEPLAQTSYALSVRDANLSAADTLGVNYYPRFLLVRSVGRGPKGATKVLEMMIDRFMFDYDAPASLVMREAEDNTSHLFMDAGSGGPTYSGKDRNSSILKGAVGVGNSLFNSNTDYLIAAQAMLGIPLKDQPGGIVKMGSGVGELPWPAPVRNTAEARSFVAAAKVAAQQAMDSGAGYLGDCPGNKQALNGLIVITGTCSLGSGNNGAGFMVATGDLTLDGSFNFEGLVFVLGSGSIRRNGSGGSSNGQIYGGILAAQFGNSGGFGAVNFNSNGAGSSIVQYDSVAIANALSQFGPKVLGVVEK